MLPEDRLSQIVQRFEFLEAQLNAGAAPDQIARISREYAELKPVVEQIARWREAGAGLAEAEAMLADPEMRDLAADELARLRDEMPALEQALRIALLPRDAADARPAIIEIRPGTGGDEAALFAGDLLSMYRRHAEQQGWTFQMLDLTETELGGVKEAVARGMIPGPRMQISVIMLSQTGGHGDDWCLAGADAPFMVAHPGRPSGLVDGPYEVRRRVREIIRAGADVIKVATTGGVLSPNDDPRHPHFRDDEIAEMTAEATAAGIHVMAHAQGAGGIKAALRNGVRSIEHGIFLDDEAIEMMLQRGAWLVPTLICWVIWSATMFGEFPWPAIVTVATGVRLLQLLITRQETIESIERRLERKEHKRLASRQRRELRQPPPRDRGD